MSTNTKKPNTMSTNQIRAFSPCASGWQKLLKHLGKVVADDEQIPFVTILESNGVRDAIWCMRVNWFEHKEQYMEFVTACSNAAAAYADAAAAAYADAADDAYDAYADAAYAAYAAEVAYAAYAADAAAAAAYTAAAANAAAAAYAATYAAAAADDATAAAYAADAERERQYNLLLTLFN